MKVLLQARVNLFTVPGGDTVQILKTQEYLRKQGVEAELSLELAPDLSGIDLVHVFNLTRVQETYQHVRHAKKHGKPVALSTIYWSFDEFEKAGQFGWRRWVNHFLNVQQIEYGKALWRWFKDGQRNPATAALLRHGYRHLQEEVLKQADVLLPNSRVEADLVVRDFGSVAQRVPIEVVPNAVEEAFLSSASDSCEHQDELRNGILCVARIETRKNQLNLALAARELGVPVFFAGDCAPNHVAYRRHIQEVAGPGAHFLGRLDPTALSPLYAAAKVHALTSWFETPGLSSLEAGLMGCNVVVTDRGSVREYFEDAAFYCEPDSVESIRVALSKALVKPKDSRLAERISRNFTWDKAAEATIRGYGQVLEATS